MATSLKRVRRTKAAGSPEPRGIASMSATCGHSGCGQSCNVRYCGPTSPMHNHHIVHAARGATHIWTAAIVSGLAVVLTGAIAFSSVQAAETRVEPNDPIMLIMRALFRIEQRLDRMEPRLNRVSESGSGMSQGIGDASKPQCVLQCIAAAESDTQRLGTCIAEKCPDLMRKNSATSTGDMKTKDPALKTMPLKPKPMPLPTETNSEDVQ